MKEKLIIVVLLTIAILGKSQTAADLFNPSDIEISWLGVDFSHVKLIGEFSQFSGAGEQSNIQIRDKYFVAWNKLILAEPDKYDIKEMLRIDTIIYDLDMLMEVNSATKLEDMESYNNPNFTENDIKNFISTYNTDDKVGIGIMFLAECLNKNEKVAYFHFIALSMKTKELLIHERLRGKPKGFGFRNYWAGSINRVIKEIKNERYEDWVREFN